MENYILKTGKLLKYINQFWICFNEEDRKDMLKILIKVLDRADANVDDIITQNKN